MKKLLWLSIFCGQIFAGGFGGGGSGNATKIQGTAVSATPPSGTQCLVASGSPSTAAWGSCSAGSGISGSWSSTGNVVTTDGADAAQDSGTAFSSVCTLAGTQTLTNKTLTSPAVNSATWGGTTATGQGNSKILESDSSGNLTSATAVTGGQLPTFTGDVTNSAAAMTVAKIQGVSVGTPTGTGNVVMSASPTLTGTAVLASATLSGTLKKSNCMLTNIETDSGNSGSTLSWDLSTANVFTTTLTASPTITISNYASAACPSAFVFTQDGTGSRTVTFSGPTIIWTGGISTLSTAAGAVDLVSCIYNGAISKLMCSLNANLQ